MSTYTREVLIDQIGTLNERLAGPFPYEECRRLLSQLHEAEASRGNKGYDDLIPDLDSYLYLVSSHSGGASKLAGWTSSELVISQKLLVKSFFESHRKYRSLEWMINEINTPRLYLMLMLSNELRIMLQKLISDLVIDSERTNSLRQKEFLYA